MADVFVNFGRGFRLNLEGGRFIDFKAGPQQVDEVLLKHWYVNANRVDINPGLINAGGTQEFLKEDIEFARMLMQEEEESQKRRQTIMDMRQKAAQVQVQSTIAAMGGSRADLTPEQQEMVAAAERQAVSQSRAATKEILATLETSKDGIQAGDTALPANAPAKAEQAAGGKINPGRASLRPVLKQAS